MATTKLNNFISNLKNVSQGSQQWLEERKLTVGGSELYMLKTNRKQLLKQKLKLIDNFSTLPMLWGTCFEKLTKYITMILTGIHIVESPGNIPSCEVVGKSFSPDGFGIDGDKIILFEFKTLWSRLIKHGLIYKPYIDQVMSGMSDISVVDESIFVETTIKRSSYNDLDVKDCIMCGFVTITWLDTKYFTPDSDDIGMWEDRQLKTLLELCKSGKALMKFSPVTIWGDTKFVEIAGYRVPTVKTNHQPNKTQSNLVGFMGWKLMDVNTVKTPKQVGYTKQYEQLIVEFCNELNALYKLSPNERQAAFQLKYEKKSTVVDNDDDILSSLVV